MPEPALHVLYARLLDAARRQLEMLAADDMDAFQTATTEREAAFAAVLARDAELKGLDEARSAEIRTIIGQILASDVELERQALEAAARTKEELGLVQQGLHALHAYASERTPQAYFIDQNG